MATVVKRGSGTPATTGTTWASATLAVDGTAGTNGVTYATMTSTTSAAVATIEVTGYDFASTVGSADTLNSVSVAVRHFENNTGRFASVTFQAFDGATSIGTATTCTLATGARTDTATVSATLAQLRSSTFKIRCTITGAASTQSRVFSLDQIDVTADYTPLAPTITQSAYRIYDDGTETGAVALAAQDTAANGDITSGDGIGQLRVRLQSTNAGVINATDDWQLQWERNTSGTWVSVGSDALADSYPNTNDFGAGSLSSTGLIQAQSFTGNGGKLTRVRFWGYKQGTGGSDNVVASLFAHTGSFGSSSTGTGAALATSTPVAGSSVQGTISTPAWTEFVFNGTFTLTAATRYVIGVGRSGASDFSNYYATSIDGTSPTHAGNNSVFSGGSWSADVLSDMIFEVYTPATTVVVPYASANTTDGAATTNRLGAGSGSFVAGKISETGLVTDLGWSANNYTELLFPVAIKKPDVVAGDVIRFRVLRNGATTGMTYTAVPTVNVVQGGGGPGTIATSWGSWTATASAGVEHSATITSGWGGLTATAVAMVEVTATAATSWGAFTATATGTVTAGVVNWPATITTNWGAWTGTGVGLKQTTLIELFGGGADGAAITTANTIFTQSIVGGAEFDDDVWYKPPQSMRIVSDSTARYGRRDTLDSAACSVSVYVRFASVAPTSNLIFLSFYTSAGTGCCHLGLTSTGRIAGFNASVAFITGTNIAGHAVIANNWYRIDALVTVGAGTGRLQYRICNVQGGDTNTPITTAFDSAADETFSAGNFNRVYLGATAATARNGDWNFAIFRYDNTRTTFFDAYPWDFAATISSGWGAWVATAAGTVTTGPVDQPATITTNWGLWVATASPAIVEHPATALAPWGSTAATGVAVVDHPATITTPWGGWTTTAVGTFTSAAAIVTNWGGWVAHALGSQLGQVSGVISTGWGGWTATAVGKEDHTASISTGWGGLTATAVGVDSHPATISSAWGGIATSAPATVSRKAVGTSNWSLRVADSSADVDRHATITTTWAWTATAVGAPSKPATISTTWSGWTATSAAVVDHPATTLSVWSWSATAIAGQDHYATITTGWGTLSATALAVVTEHATITSNWGRWDARAYQEGVLAARIDSVWGPMTATAVGVHVAVWGQWNGHAVTDIWWGDQDASEYLMLV